MIGDDLLIKVNDTQNEIEKHVDYISCDDSLKDLEIYFSATDCQYTAARVTSSENRKRRKILNLYLEVELLTKIESIFIPLL